jgi:hypothetical protein
MAIKKQYWVEPAHPAVVRRFDDLVDIYRFVRSQFQERIDTIFDGVSRQIGFVVTTTLPVVAQVAQEGRIAKVAFTAGNLEGTLFEKEFAPVFKEMAGAKQQAKIRVGEYQFQLIWYAALKLRLRADWVEPAHFQMPSALPDVSQQSAVSVPPEVQEPAHWFDAGTALAKDEELIIAAIDEVYPELKLAERIAAGRAEARMRVPGIREPAHFRALLEDILVNRRTAATAGVSRQLSPGIREPAHFTRLAEMLERPDIVDAIVELAEVLKRYR